MQSEINIQSSRSFLKNRSYREMQLTDRVCDCLFISIHLSNLYPNKENIYSLNKMFHNKHTPLWKL